MAGLLCGRSHRESRCMIHKPHIHWPGRRCRLTPHWPSGSATPGSQPGIPPQRGAPARAIWPEAPEAPGPAESPGGALNSQHTRHALRVYAPRLKSHSRGAAAATPRISAVPPVKPTPAAAESMYLWAHTRPAHRCRQLSNGGCPPALNGTPTSRRAAALASRA